jgi:hypothetical protein
MSPQISDFSGFLFSDSVIEIQRSGIGDCYAAGWLLPRMGADHIFEK